MRGRKFILKNFLRDKLCRSPRRILRGARGTPCSTNFMSVLIIWLLLNLKHKSPIVDTIHFLPQHQQVPFLQVIWLYIVLGSIHHKVFCNISC
ncbi:hypothetical protein Sjap_002467 [Stephania japonica]|uniref:Uncharacterized protein n=1 Tax=Stephania japonica TaxID=461633 RepID=A0AAP0PSN5_9MAGN